MTLTASPEAECARCGRAFLRFRTTQRACSPACALKLVRVAKKQEAEQTRARRVALRSRRDWLRDTQQAFNTWVRFRDAHLPCISCGKATGSHWDAGHYLTVGARPELRFTPENCQKQCIRCNQHLHGNVAMYRVGLIDRIGVAAVEALEGPHPPAKWSTDELKTMRDAFRLATKQLREQQRETPARTPTAAQALHTPAALPSADAQGCPAEPDPPHALATALP